MAAEMAPHTGRVPGWSGCLAEQDPESGFARARFPDWQIGGRDPFPEERIVVPASS